MSLASVAAIAKNIWLSNPAAYAKLMCAITYIPHCDVTAEEVHEFVRVQVTQYKHAVPVSDEFLAAVVEEVKRHVLRNPKLFVEIGN